MLKLRTILLYDYLYLILVIICLLYSLLFTNFVHLRSKYSIDNTKLQGYIYNFKVDGNQLKLYLKGKEKIIVNYYFETKQEKNSYHLELGDYIEATGVMTEPKKNTVFNLFNYKKYLYNKKIFFTFEADSISKLKGNNKLRYKIKQSIIRKIDSIEEGSNYLRALILGDISNIDDSVNDSYQYNGVNHLFAISGSHISFLAAVLLFIFKKIRIKELQRYLMVMLILCFYMFLTNFTGSVLRSTIFFILLSFNKIYYFNIKTVNVLWLTLFLLLMTDPYLIYDIGFQFSFMISLYLIMYQELINKYSSFLLKTLIISLIAFIASIPILAFNFFQINFLSPLINLFFVPFVTLLLFPLTLLTFCFPFLNIILLFFIEFMEKISLILSSIKIGQFILPKPSIIIFIMYYVVITIMLKQLSKNNYRFALLFLIILVIHHNYNFFVSKPIIVFIDVGQGDSILINLPHNKGTILIDTGGKLQYDMPSWKKRNSEYSIGKDTIIPFLKSIGIKKLDYLILTHGDADHMGESLAIVNNINVDNVIINNGDKNQLEKALIATLKAKKINYDQAKADDTISVDKYNFYFLSPMENIDENSNSLVIYTELNNHRILLTGDMPSKIEQKLVNTYNLKNMDILKLGHHGSITSSSEQFLDKIKPEYGIIQVGLNNRFNHPSKVVLERLKKRKIKVFLTSIDGSIKFSLAKDNVTIWTCLS